MSLSELVKFLTLLLHKEKIGLNFDQQQCWHTALYNIKKLPEMPGKPASLEGIFFDWNGPYPVCKELDDYLWGMGCTGCVEWSTLNMHEYELVKGVAAIWDEEYRRLTEDEKHFLGAALRCVQLEFIEMAV
ncbi:MAG: hypothetical protein P4L67_04015 [Candidatus Pacebacteria bacterium]|nr:hypothetical protein [Candidatus Paceibacterota bacterium]